MTYFHRRAAYYHWRGSVSPSCSGWEGVVPLCYGRQTKGWGPGLPLIKGDGPEPAFGLSGVPSILRSSADCFNSRWLVAACRKKVWVVTASHTHTACFSKLYDQASRAISTG